MVLVLVLHKYNLAWPTMYNLFPPAIIYIFNKN